MYVITIEVDEVSIPKTQIKTALEPVLEALGNINATDILENTISCPCQHSQS